MGDRKQFPTGVRPHNENIQIKYKTRESHPNYIYQTLDWKPTKANIIKAGKLRQKIVDAVKFEIYNHSDFFPDKYPSQLLAKQTFADYCQQWLDHPESDWSSSSRYKYLGNLERVWMPSLHKMNINSITYNHLLNVLKVTIKTFEEQHDKKPSQSTYNDWLTCVRGVFKVAEKDTDCQLVKSTNPTYELENKTRPKTLPDPFDIEEANLIIENIYENDGGMWGSFFEFCFYSGVRFPSEPSALPWSNIDFRKREFRIDRITSRHEKDGIKNTTKTGVERIVDMNSRTEHALKVAHELSGFKNTNVFLQGNLTDVDATHVAITTGDPQRVIFKAALGRLGIRERDTYNMRHTFASFALMQGVNPAFMATQLGHSKVEFFKTYAKWIDGASHSLQQNLIENGIKPRSKNKAEENQLNLV